MFRPWTDHRADTNGERVSGNDVGVQNPWLQFSDTPPFIAPADAETLGRLRGKLLGDYELKLDSPPTLDGEREHR